MSFYYKKIHICQKCSKSFLALDKKVVFCDDCKYTKCKCGCGKLVYYTSKTGYYRGHHPMTKQEKDGHKRQGLKMRGDNNPAKRSNVRKKLSESIKKTHWSKKYPEKFQEYMKKIRPLSWVLTGRSKVEEKLSILYPNYQRYVKIGTYEVDFCNEHLKHIIEIQGCYWHGCEKCFPNSKLTQIQINNKKNDERKKVFLEKLGYRVDYVWEHSLNKLLEEKNIMMTCSRKIHFSYGHRVWKHESKCKYWHGHNGIIWFHARAPKLDDLDRVIDFGVLKEKLGKFIDDEWDHGFIYNEQDKETENALNSFNSSEFKQKMYALPGNPTAEVMASYLLEVICPQLLVGTGVEIFKVTFYETENCFAEASLEN